MSTYHHVVLRDDKGEYVARVRAWDYGLSINQGAGGQFDTEVLPTVITAAEALFGRRLTPIWVDDMSCDGWDNDPDMSAPWDGPASLYDEPDLPDLVPASGDLRPSGPDRIILTEFAVR